jgi:hypothetical protein
MQRIDLIGAFRAASARGLSLEETKASLISAGYNPQDVEDSMQAFLRGATRPTPSARPLPGFPSLPSLQPSGKGITYPALAKPPLTFPPLAAAPVELGGKKKMPAYLLIAIIITSLVVAAALGFVLFSILSK